MSRSRRWTFTMNNYTAEQVLTITDLTKKDDGSAVINYIVVGYEIGDQGTPHLQGYVEFCVKRTLTSVKSFVGQSGHFEVSQGNAIQNTEYCTKDKDILIQWGEPMTQGKRKDIEDVISAIQQGSTIKQLWIEFPRNMVLHEKGIRSAYKILSPHVVVQTPCYALNTFSWKTDFDWSLSQIFWGNSGIGKTEFARALLPKALLISHMDDLLTYDHVEHDGLIFDDMDFKHIHRGAQIHIFDQAFARSLHCRYACAHIPANTKKIFTTNEIAGNIFLRGDAAIERRVKVTHLIKV